ncbi:hypothetical protein CEXT_656201 [Caerostris extrusa]|uniref:Uncharacterized protein n=1 Tax=Caerostris extrusa TaxID=172846 RepID=A0AAV4MXT9_CAEEX|nr:hypothetical protein CEXT_656201 [Caerostris extrusa]
MLCHESICRVLLCAENNVFLISMTSDLATDLTFAYFQHGSQMYRDRMHSKAVPIFILLRILHSMGVLRAKRLYTGNRIRNGQHLVSNPY